MGGIIFDQWKGAGDGWPPPTAPRSMRTASTTPRWMPIDTSMSSMVQRGGPRNSGHQEAAREKQGQGSFATFKDPMSSSSN